MAEDPDEILSAKLLPSVEEPEKQNGEQKEEEMKGRDGDDVDDGYCVHQMAEKGQMGRRSGSQRHLASREDDATSHEAALAPWSTTIPYTHNNNSFYQLHLHILQ